MSSSYLSDYSESTQFNQRPWVVQLEEGVVLQTWELLVDRDDLATLAVVGGRLSTTSTCP